MSVAAYLVDIDAIQQKIADTKARLDALSTDPLPVEDAIRAAESAVDQLASRVEIRGLAGRFFAVHKGIIDDPVRWMSGVLDPAGRTRGDLGPILAFVVPGLLKGALKLAIEQHGKSLTPGIPLAKRPAERLRLEKELLQYEREEERLICAAEDAGVEVFRRADVNPAVVLLVEDAA